jgi:hypothetical protein
MTFESAIKNFDSSTRRDRTKIFESCATTFGSVAMIFDYTAMIFESVIKTSDSIAMIFDSRQANDF